MIPGSNQSPYRTPCIGTTLCGNGNRHQQAKASEKNIPVYIYDSQVPNYNTEIGGEIAPYERYADNSGGTCQANGCDDEPDSIPCHGWIGNTYADQYSPVAGAPNPLPAPLYYQPYMVTGVTVDASGENYVVGDVLGAVGGTVSTYIPMNNVTYLNGATFTVTAVNETGGITGIAIASPGSYQTKPATPNSPDFGSGTGATLNLTFGPQTENITSCFKYGFKNVQAMRQWHGQPGYYFNYNPAIYTCNDGTYGDNCDVTIYNQFITSPSQTKYLNAAYEITGQFFGFVGNCPDFDPEPTGQGNFDDTYFADVSVDPNSGVITISDAGFGCGGAQWFAYIVNWTLEDWVTEFTSLNGSNVLTIGNLYEIDGPMFGPSDTYSISCGTTSYEFSGDDGGEYPNTSGSASWSFGEGTFSGTKSYAFVDHDDDGTFSGWTATESVTVEDDSVSFSFFAQDEEESTFTTVYDFTITINLSNPWTATDVLTDVYALLDEWDLTNDAQYPWRIDGNTSFAPMVTRNEVGENVAPLSFTVFGAASDTQVDDCLGNSPDNPSYVATCATAINSDENALFFDGSMIGAPLPAGYQGYFDFFYSDWQACFDTDADEWLGYLFGWGQNCNSPAGQFGLPRTATHWTSQNLAWGMPGGAWVFYNYTPTFTGCGDYDFPAVTTAVVAQKWAETKMGFPSQNFVRPGGADKFAYDEENVYAISSITGSGTGAEVSLITCTGCVAADISPPANSLWGGPAVGGFYEVTGTGSTLTLGELIYAVPSDWPDESSDQAYCFGMLRWPGSPAILGLGSISNVANTGPVELTTETLTTLGLNTGNDTTNFPYDLVDILDATMATLASGVQVTRIDDSHFTVPTAYSTIQNAQWIVSHGAPAYYWDDQYPKGDFVYTDWTHWPRLVCEPERWNAVISDCPPDGETCECPSGDETNYCYVYNNFTMEANCVAFSPCSPSVLCISPNDESFDTGVTYPFPAADALPLDDAPNFGYGNGWSAEFQQVMQDLLYQVPHYPATNPCTDLAFQWVNDGGGCNADSEGPPPIRYYPQPPMVEARLTVPSGAPALPSGITIGWVSPANIENTGSCTAPSDMLFPASANGYGVSTYTLWNLWQNLCACVDGDERFVTIYENQVVGCE
jgi:hypothetical protein